MKSARKRHEFKESRKGLKHAQHSGRDVIWSYLPGTDAIMTIVQVGCSQNPPSRSYTRSLRTAPQHPNGQFQDGPRPSVLKHPISTPLSLANCLQPHQLLAFSALNLIVLSLAHTRNLRVPLLSPDRLRQLKARNPTLHSVPQSLGQSLCSNGP